MRSPKKYRIKISAVVIALLWLLSVMSPQERFVDAQASGLSDVARSESSARLTDAQVSEAYGKLPLRFESNRGQADPRVKFISRSSSSVLLLTSDEAVLMIGGAGKQKGARAAAARLRMKLVGASRDASIEGLAPLAGTSNYLRGSDPRRWVTDVPSYGKVRYGDVYPGIDLVYYGNGRQLEYDFVVAADGNHKLIRLSFEGAKKIRIDREGDLVLRTAAGDVRMHKPVAYQMKGGVRREVESRYVLTGKRQAGFEVGAFDTSLPLVIDPVLTYSTFLGGTTYDDGKSIAVDSAGNAYILGKTSSFNFPTNIDAYNSTYKGSTDLFVTKLNATGTDIIYSTFIGGNSYEYGYGLAIDTAGNAYVTGATNSQDFPITPGAFQPIFQGSYYGVTKAFVTKLNAAGTALVYSTYLGGSTGGEQGNGIAVDASGNAYVGGMTFSNNFPTTVGAYQPTTSQGNDGFVTKLNSTGTGLVYSTYLGGASQDQVMGIAIDSSGNAYVTGATSSTNFPTTPNAFQTTFGGASNNTYWMGDAFVAKLNDAGTALVYSTYVGGGNDESGNAITLSQGGQAFIAGQTYSHDYPVTTDVVKAANGGAAKSVDGGQHWGAINSGMPSTFNATVLSLAIDPSNPLTLYAGTGGGGILKSTNAGANWTAINSGLTDLQVKSLVIDPSNVSTIYLGTASRGVFRSTDAGGSWKAINTGQNGMNVNALAIDPANHLTLYAGTEYGVSKSTNGGANWSLANTGISASNAWALAIDPVNSSTIYAGFYYGGGLYKSTNGGASWTLTGLTGGGVKTVVINPSSPMTLYAGTDNSALRSTDGGSTWVAINKGLVNRTVNVLAISPDNPLVIYAGTAGGVSKSTDGGNTWAVPGFGLLGGTVNALAIDPASPQNLYAGTVYGQSDGFVTGVNPDGTGLVSSTLLGGSNNDKADAIALNQLGQVYVTGYTTSPNFPITPGTYPSLSNGFGSEVFVTKLTASAGALAYSTLLGGFNTDWGAGIAVDSSGSAYITGSTQSRDFPTTNGAYQTLLDNKPSGFDGDAFVAKLAVSPSLMTDLKVEISVTSEGTGGSYITYNITVTNEGTDPAYGITISDELSPLVLFSGCNSPSFSCNRTGNTVFFTLNSLAPGASTKVTVSANVRCDIEGNATINNLASVEFSGTDTDTSDNTATASTNASPSQISLTPLERSFPTGGGSDYVYVDNSTGCYWQASSNASWVTLSYNQGCCSSYLYYTVATNSGGPRSATITIAGKTHTVTQAGTCSYDISPASAVFQSASGASSFNVTAPAGCGWTATTPDSWIHIMLPNNGSGDGIVNYSVEQNSTGSARTGSITVAGKTHTVTQEVTIAIGKRFSIADMDGDGKSDIGFYRNGLWAFLKSTAGFDYSSAQYFSWGGAGIQPVVADFDGDGKSDIAYIGPPAGGQSAAYAILKSTTNYDYAQAQFVPAGWPSLGDTPVVGDFDKDGKAEPGVWRPSGGVWIIPLSSSNYTQYIFSSWGQAGDTPVIADIDGDGKSDIGFYRNGLWAFLKSTQSFDYSSAQYFSWGGAGIQPVVADFDGDGKSDIAYIGPPAGGQSAAYAILKSTTNYDYAQAQFVPAGWPSLGDTPVVGDFDKDGKAEPGVWRPSGGVWIIPLSSSSYSSYLFSSWGQPGDIPLSR